MFLYLLLSLSWDSVNVSEFSSMYLRKSWKKRTHELFDTPPPKYCIFTSEDDVQSATRNHIANGHCKIKFGLLHLKPSRCKIKFWPPQLNTDPGSIFNGFFVELWPSLAVEFWSRCWILKPSWVAIPRVEDIYTGQNSTLNCDPGSKLHFELWPRVRIPHWIVIPIPGHNLSLGHNSTCNQDPGSQLNVESWPGSQFNVESWSGSKFNVESWPGVTIQRWVMTRVTIQRGIKTPGQNLTLNYDPGHLSKLNCDPIPTSQLNVESCLGVTIQRGIKTWGHNSTWNKDPRSQFNWGSKFYPSRGRYTMTPCLGGSQFNMKKPLNSDHSRWIKTPRVEIQWGQNSILHRH